MSEQFSAIGPTASAVSGGIDAEQRAARQFVEQAMYDEAIACCRRMEDLDIRDETAPELIAAAVIAQNREHAGMQPDGRLLRPLKARPPAADQPRVGPSPAATNRGPP